MLAQVSEPHSETLVPGPHSQGFWCQGPGMGPYLISPQMLTVAAAQGQCRRLPWGCRSPHHAESWWALEGQVGLRQQTHCHSQKWSEGGRSVPQMPPLETGCWMQWVAGMVGGMLVQWPALGAGTSTIRLKAFSPLIPRAFVPTGDIFVFSVSTDLRIITCALVISYNHILPVL